MRRRQQKVDRQLKGMRWTLLKDGNKLNLAQTDRPRGGRQSVHHHAHGPSVAFPRATARDILERKQVNIVSQMLHQWCANVMRLMVEPIKDMVRLIRRHVDEIVAKIQTRQTNGFIEAINDPFSGRQTQSTRVRSFRNHAHGPVPHRWKTRLRTLQWKRPLSPVGHSVFK
ncbi:transposase [Paraburkholderia dipogonis]|uniref:transposase n=1 Tax=Paraburkholderia dipogonis TaxID=1211383 RepID=UPI001FCCA73D|nr:transposase [Paraburkholderia dipogonis]